MKSKKCLRSGDKRREIVLKSKQKRKTSNRKPSGMTQILKFIAGTPSSDISSPMIQRLLKVLEIKELSDKDMRKIIDDKSVDLKETRVRNSNVKSFYNWWTSRDFEVKLETDGGNEWTLSQGSRLIGHRLRTNA